MKRGRRKYDEYERRDNEPYGEDLRRRSMSPRDTARREKLHESRRDDTRYSRQRDCAPQTNSSSRRDEREAHHVNRRDSLGSHSNYRAIERSPSTSSTRHRDHHHSRHHHHRHHRHRRSSNHSTRTPDELPFGARTLVRSDLETFKPLFAQYLDVQKRKDIATMDEREIRGRWKSFVGKWNHGDLAEGWYRPETLEEARKSGASAYAQPSTGGNERGLEMTPSIARSERDQSRDSIHPEDKESGGSDDDDDEDDEYGPTLPPSTAPAAAKHGPGIPSLQDLDLRRETAEDERQQRIDDLRLARRADRAEQKARLEDLVPRAEPGTRERALEKKREVNEKMRAFRERSPVAEVGEAELMGGGDDGVAEYKKMRDAAERRKTEREVRREEEGRARAKEREERVREYKKREEGTMEVLRRIARERFG